LRVVAGLYERWRLLVHELAKFGIVGAVNTVLDFGLANLLYLGFGWPGGGTRRRQDRGVVVQRGAGGRVALGMVFRFATYKRFVFVSHERAAARSPQPAGSRAGASS
jgi:hypothetical protein